jgi:spermidine synthase
MADRRHTRVIYIGLLICFFLSGAAGLIYEVAWGKAFGLIFGHTAYAAAAVLAVFMGGLAAGGIWLGRWSERWTRPIASYGWIEVGTAFSAAASLTGLAAVRWAYFAVYPYASEHSSVLLSVRVIGAALVLFVPTFLMGGTLPVLVRGLARDSAELGQRLARLYWVNTAGAVFGTVAAGFLLLPAIGLQRTLEIAVALNLGAGGFAFFLSRREEGVAPATGAKSAAKQQDSRFLLACLALVGATALAYEVGWTRLLATQVGSSTYAFTLMLATFLAGIVLGSAAFERWIRRHEARRTTFALTQTLTGIASLVCLAFFPRMPELMPAILRATQESFRASVVAQFAISALAMLPAAILFGFNFPVATLLITRQGWGESSDSAGVGRAYGWSTFGGILGALAAGFWLLPLLGAFRLIAVTVAANLVLAAVLFGTAAPRRMAASVANLGLVVVAGFVALSPYFYDPALASFSTILNWNSVGPLTVRESAHTADVLFFADGVNSTISVARWENMLSLRTNGKPDASNQDITTQLLLGHLGALAHPRPRRVLVIGFGSGMTVSALARYPEVERVDSVEIEPAVLRAAPLLTSLNRNVLDDPRVHVIFDDARNFLFTSRERYDLIVSEPSNPWMAGVASLYTREFYSAVQRRLTSGGIFVQWVQAYSLYPPDLRTILATFLSEFQGATLWHGEVSDFLLMAPSPPVKQIVDRVGSLWSNSSLNEDFSQLGMEEPGGLFGLYLLGDRELRAFAAGAPINTDDLTLLEYHAPRSLLAQNLGESNRSEILRAQNEILPGDLPPDLRDATLSAAATGSLNLSDLDGADRFASAVAKGAQTAQSAIARGRVALAHANFEEAKRDFNLALSLEPKSIRAAWGRAEVNRGLGNDEAAREQLLDILKLDPKYLPAMTSLVRADVDLMRWVEAAELQQQLIAANPRRRASDYEQLGELLLRTRNYSQGRDALQECLARDPYNIKAHLYLGVLFRQQQLWTEALENLEFVRRFSPAADAGTYKLLYEVYQGLGDTEAASKAARFGLRIFPDNSDLQRLTAER